MPVLFDGSTVRNFGFLSKYLDFNRNLTEVFFLLKCKAVKRMRQ